jgi:hypothetical protein
VKPSGLSLDRLQRWMQSVVVHPGDVEEALSSGAARTEIDPARLQDVILPAPELSPADRVGIYHRMYFLRMYDALSSDYYALEHFLGEQAFGELVRDYVEAHPSSCFSLNRLGDHLPAYIRERSRLSRNDFCAELAELELAVTHVFDAEETPSLTPEEIAAVPQEAWYDAVLEPVAAFRLLAFRYPVNAYLQTVKDEDHENHPRPRRRSEWVAIYRRHYSVYRLALTREGHALLEALRAGRPLGEAIGVVSAKGGSRGPEQLLGWFWDWVNAGLFRGVRLPQTAS